MSNLENEKKFKAIDGETLLDMDIPSTGFIIKGLRSLADGLEKQIGNFVKEHSDTVLKQR